MLAAGCGPSKKKVPIIEEKCGTCHATDRIYMYRRTKAEWDRAIHGMKNRGLILTEAEEQEIKAILYDRFGRD